MLYVEFIARKNHAVIMAHFARDIHPTMIELTQKPEVALG
jgi:hypothetical protein